MDFEIESRNEIKYWAGRPLLDASGRRLQAHTPNSHGCVLIAQWSPIIRFLDLELYYLAILTD